MVVEVAEGSVSLEQWLWFDVVWLYGKILSYLKEPFHIAEKIVLFLKVKYDCQLYQRVCS